MNILIGSLIRNREWILPRFLTNVTKLNYPKEKITLCFILNDSQDSCHEILENFKKEFEKYYKQILITEINLGTQEDMRVGNRKPVYKSLSQLRNMLLTKGSEFDYLFSIDSDILVNPEDLNFLLSAQKDVVSGIIENGTGIFNLMTIKLKGHLSHYKTWHDEKQDIFEVDVNGAVTLISKKVCETCKYSFNDRGEDIGFAQNVQQNGFRLYAHKKVRPQHIMTKEIA